MQKLKNALTILHTVKSIMESLPSQRTEEDIKFKLELMGQVLRIGNEYMTSVKELNKDIEDMNDINIIAQSRQIMAYIDKCMDHILFGNVDNINLFSTYDYPIEKYVKEVIKELEENKNKF